MIISFLLFDVRPDSVPTGAGVTGLILIGIVVSMLSVATITVFVFLLRWRLRQKTVVTQTQRTTTRFQPSSPNQP